MLDPTDWPTFRAASHRALDAALDSIQRCAAGPVWRPVPDDVRARFEEPMPQEGRPLDAVVDAFLTHVAAFPTGNQHPRFFGWVQGSAAPGGAVADLLAAAMNANVGGRDHAAVYVERQVIRWFADAFGLPRTTNGVMTVGTSAATLVAVVAARAKALGASVRERGVADARLVGYASTAVHGCVRKAFSICGLGTAALRELPADAEHRLDPSRVACAIAEDRAAGLQPFLIVGTAGSVDVGAVDPLDELARVAHEADVWLHVDGAFGALAALSPSLRPHLRGIERADSVAFDFHKWLRVPYDAGCVLIRDGELQHATFKADGAYLKRFDRGLAAASPWFADLGVDLSRGFRALKVWFTLYEHGARTLAASIEENVRLAQMLARAIDDDGDFERTAPAALNIVCFRYRAPQLNGAEMDAFTDALSVAVQESGDAVVSATTVNGRRTLRACFVNHRTRDDDVAILVETVRREARRLLN